MDGTRRDNLKRAEDEGWSSWIRSDADERAVANGCRFDEAAAIHVATFFIRFLRHSKGQWAGKPFELLPWQRDEVIGPLFGWKRADGTRRFRRAYVEVPKKNGKSSMCAGIGLYLLVADGEPGAEVYSAAVDRSQALIVFREAASMVEQSPALAARLAIRKSAKTITHEEQGSFYRALSREVSVQEGLNIHGLIFDELHAQRTADLWNTLRYGGSARRQPLQIAITTAGYDRHSICWEQHDYARKVLDGTIQDEAFFAYIRAAEDGDDWTDPAVWEKANPSLGVMISLAQFTEDCREAQESPAQENNFKRYRLNIWTEQSVRWLPMEKWDSCADATDPEDLLGRECFAGLDLATTTDLTALVLLFPDDEGGYDVLPFFWAPRENARARQRRDRVPYVDWAQRGLIELTEGDVTDYAAVRRRINEIAEQYNVREIAVDRVFQGAQLCTELGEQDGHEVISFGQGFMSMAAPTAEFERLVLAGKIRHGGHPIMRWMAANASVKTDPAGNLKPDKAKSTERIDGIVAAIMALGRAMVGVESGSVYDSGRGLLVINLNVDD